MKLLDSILHPIATINARIIRAEHKYIQEQLALLNATPDDSKRGAICQDLSDRALRIQHSVERQLRAGEPGQLLISYNVVRQLRAAVLGPLLFPYAAQSNECMSLAGIFIAKLLAHGKVVTTDTINTLIRFSSTRDADAATSAIASIGEICALGAVPTASQDKVRRFLIGSLRRNNADIRYMAIHALGKLHKAYVHIEFPDKASIVDSFFKSLKDSDKFVRSGARKYLSEIRAMNPENELASRIQREIDKSFIEYPKDKQFELKIFPSYN